MSDMITSNGKQPREMTLKELKYERFVQRWFARQVNRIANLEEFKYETGVKKMEEEDPLGKLKERYKSGELTETQYKKKINGVNHTIRANERRAYKIMMLRNLEEALRFFVLEIEDAMKYHKTRPKTYKWITKKTPYRWDLVKHKYRHYITKEQIAVDKNKKLLKKYETLINRSGVVLQWDRRKLMLVAADRGYFSEQAVAYAIEECLEMPKYAIQKLLKEGKFTWGQVLVIGALFEMTPKEFCDTFMLGYFVEHGGKWQASFDNIDKNGLLAQTPIIKRGSGNRTGKEKTDSDNGTNAD